MNAFIVIMAIAALLAGVMAMKFYFDAKTLRRQLNEEQRHNEKLVGDHVARETGLETDLSKWQKVASKRVRQIDQLIGTVAALREAVYVLGKEDAGRYINEIGVMWCGKVRLEGGPGYHKTRRQLNPYDLDERLDQVLQEVNDEMRATCARRSDLNRQDDASVA